jgi:hypothetical protein
MLIAAGGWLHQFDGESCSNLDHSRQETEDISWSPSVAVLQQSVQYRSSQSLCRNIPMYVGSCGDTKEDCCQTSPSCSPLPQQEDLPRALPSAKTVHL